MQIANLFSIYLLIGITCFGFATYSRIKQRNDVQDFEEKYEELFKYTLLDKNIKEISSEELTKYATLLSISMKLSEVSNKEKEAFFKVFKKYKSTVDQETEKKKWFEDYSRAKDNLEKIEHSWKGTKEEMKILQEFNKLYEKISKKLK